MNDRDDEVTKQSFDEFMEEFAGVARQVDEALLTIAGDTNAMLVIPALVDRAARVAALYDVGEENFAGLAEASYAVASRDIREQEKEVH